MKFNIKNFSVYFAVVGVLCSCEHEPAQDAKSVFNEYAAGWNKGDIDKVWNLMSPRLRRGNENDIGKFKSFITAQGFSPRKFDVISYKISNKDAYIVANVSFFDKSSKFLGREVQKCHMIKIRNNWYYDDCLINT